MSLKTKLMKVVAPVGASVLSVANYTPTYTSSDIAPASIDGIVTMIVVFVSFATLIGLVILWRWAKKRVR